MLTDEQKREYLEHWGCYCPWCGSQDLTVGDIDPASLGDGGYRQFMSCDACGKKWQDCYDLVDVLEVDEEEAEEDQAEVSGNLAEPVTPAEVSDDRKVTLFWPARGSPPGGGREESRRRTSTWPH